MAWIESHQELGQHPKTKRFARALQISLPAAVGHLHFLWWWALSYAQDGDLTDYAAEDIADAICWDGDPQQAVDALIKCGFVDEQDGTRSIHDWYEYAGRLIDQRQANRDRSQRARNAKKQAPNTNGTHTVRERTENVQEPNAATVPDLTQPDQTVPNQPDPTEQNHTPHSPPQAEGGGADLDQQRFDEFWANYPKKTGKADARKSWKRAKVTVDLHDRIITAIEQAKHTEQWQRDNGRFIPNPATWINQGRWDDEPMPQGTGPPTPPSGKFDTLGALRDIISDEEGGGPYDTG
jgi:hypothetical protein